MSETTQPTYFVFSLHGGKYNFKQSYFSRKEAKEAVKEAIKHADEMFGEKTFLIFHLEDISLGE